MIRHRQPTRSIERIAAEHKQNDRRAHHSAAELRAHAPADEAHGQISQRSLAGRRELLLLSAPLRKVGHHGSISFQSLLTLLTLPSRCAGPGHFRPSLRSDSSLRKALVTSHAIRELGAHSENDLAKYCVRSHVRLPLVDKSLRLRRLF